MRTAAAELLTVLHDEGISHLFVNPGMHTAPLREALAIAEAGGLPHPQPVLCVHEHVAISAAHGHHLLSESPQAVMVRMQDGHLNLDTVADDAHRCRVPLTVFCGASDLGGMPTASPRPPQPVFEPGLPGSAGKWAANLARAEDPGMLVRRAFQIARAEPTGLTRVALPADLLGAPAGQPSRRLPPPRPPAPDLAVLDEMASLLATAESPLIVAGRVGRHVASVQHLARLAEVLAAPVIDVRNNVNLPPGHPLNAGRDAAELFNAADAILLLDVDVPCLPGLGPLPNQAWFLQIDVDCVKPDWPGWMHPIEVAVTADTELALPQLLTLLGDRLASGRRRVQDRRARLERALRREHLSWRDRAASSAPEDRADAVLSELGMSLADDAVILAEVAAGLDATVRQLQRPPGHLFRCRAESPGWSIGAALGARLARPSQPVIAICDAVSFTSAHPSAAFWSAHRAGAPFLTVVLDRSGRSVPGPSAEPRQDVAAIARASGAEAVLVDEPSDVPEALERLLATTRDGVCAVMDVKLPAGPGDHDAVPRPRRSLTTASTVATHRLG